jgi:hypothetical protein
MLSDEDLFLFTVADLKARLTNPDIYNSIRVCGLLRQLLLDKTTLLSLANRAYKQKVVFEVSKSMHPPTIPSLFMSFIIPDKDDAKAVSLSSFLSLKVIFINFDNYTIAEVIQVVAHTLGGIHSYSKDEKQKKLKVLDQALHLLPVGSKPNLCYLIKEIGTVVVKALQPLESLISGRTTTGGF